jgi:hypothetical protein
MAAQGLGLLCHACGLLAPAFLLGGCLSVSYVDSSNRRHVIGFLDMVIEQAAPASTVPEPTTISMTTVGLHIYSGAPEGSGVAIGYVQGTMVIMPDNSCVSLERPGACTPDKQQLSGSMQVEETRQ